MDGVPKDQEGSKRRVEPMMMPGQRLVLVIRIGRGRTGGTTILDVCIQWAFAAGRSVVIADGDLRNATLAGLYPPGTEGGALQPPSDHLVEMKDWLTEAIGIAVRRRASLIVDFGGGDRVLVDYGRELEIVAMCESLGMEPLALYVTGPEPDDFEHILSIWRSGAFRPRRSILLMNEYLVPQGRSPGGAFDAIVSRPELKQMGREGVKVVVMPRLPCMGQVRALGLGLVAAAAGQAGKDGQTLDVVRRFMVSQWLKRLEASFTEVGALEWLP